MKARTSGILLPVTLGLAHAASDGSAGLLLGSLAHSLPTNDVARLVLLYNVLAFGGQVPLGLIVDRVRSPRGAALFGLVATIGALVTFRAHPLLAIAVAGIGSAAFHVGGGALAICATAGRASGPGLFAAPGVVGLAIGGALAAAREISVWPFVLALAALIAGICVVRTPAMPYRAERPDEPMFEGHDYVMLVLLAAIALRSAVWNIFQYLASGQLSLLMLLALAAAIGKALGGILADRLGWRRWSVGALVMAAPLLAWGGQRIVPTALGLALLQSATAPAMALMARTSPRYPATAAGLALGLGIAAGGLPWVTVAASSIGAPLLIAAMTMCAAIAVAMAAGHASVRRFASIRRNPHSASGLKKPAPFTRFTPNDSECL